MGVVTVPEKFAQRVSERYSLKPPVDVRAMLHRYAEVIDARIPILGVDGVCLNLKTPGKKTRVVINASNPLLRRRFTEAHELGHIIIPWHKGTIVDHLDPSHHVAGDDYWTFEDEANQFAAELLMPSAWVKDAVSAERDLAELHRSISSECQVSALAASRRLTTFLPRNVAFICEKGGEVEFSGKTYPLGVPPSTTISTSTQNGTTRRHSVIADCTGGFFRRKSPPPRPTKGLGERY